MSEVRVPAVRLRAPSWRDGRLIAGVLIVVVSVVVGARVVAAAGRTVPVYSAASDLPSGHRLVASDLRAVPVHLAPGMAGYLSAGAPPPAGAVVLRPVGAGELVPTEALGPASALDRRPVAVPVPAPLPSGLRPGVGVDVWSAAKETTGGTTRYAPPLRVARGAEIYAVAPARAGLADTGGGSVQVLLDEGELRAVLDALANDARITLVPVPDLPLQDAPPPASDPAAVSPSPEVPG